MRIVVVGVCASGKTTLVKGLCALGIDAYNVAQEHSCVKKLWKKRNPDILVMLDATLDLINRRRIVYWGEERLLLQRERLRDAREHSDVYIQTDLLTQAEVIQTVIEYIRRNRYGNRYGSRFEK
ncbi:MAG TPA: hypothetical protein VGL27_02220 [Negativicutes bacterium]|jgi:dephospho-CoA kinase